MKKVLFVFLFCLATVAFAQSSNPCGVAPTPGAPHVCLSWTASTTPGVTYNVYRATTANGENYATPLNAAPISAIFFYDATAAVGTQYFYKITAVIGGSMSAPSSEVSVQVPTPPAAPTNPVAAVN